MALAKQFYSSFKSYNGWDYYLEIWVEGYSGSASEISIGAGGPVITYGTDEQDRFSPILSSKLELPFMVTNTTQDAFIKNIRENFNEQDVYIHLYRESSSGYSSVAPLWSGFVLMDLSASPDLYYPYPVTLTAVDGLSLLKEIDFSKSGTAGSYTDADMYSNNGRFTYWLKEILLKSGASTTTQGSTQDYKFTTAINWFNSVMPTITQSTDPFYQTKCNTKMFFSKDADENFTVVNCYDVLKNLLKHWGARIIYWKHIFYIVQIQEYNTAESGTYANPDNIDTRTYTKTGAFDSSSDNLGDSYWTRYNLLIDDVTGGIQKLAGSQFNYLPQLKRTQAKFIDYGNKNYFGGLPYDLTTGQTDVIYQDTISDVSVDGSMILIIPLDVTMNVAYSGTLAMSLTFRMYITDGATTYYLRYDPSNTPKYYWENATTANLNFKKTVWRSNLDNIVGTQTKVGFHEQIEFKDVSGSALTLTGDWDIYTDIDNWGANSGSFKFVYAVNGLFNLQVLYAPSASTIYWTNTLNPNYQTPLNPSVIGQTNQPTAYNPNFSLNPTTSNSIVSYTSQLNINPFEGKLLIVNASASGALYGSFVSVSPNPTTKDSEIVDFGDLIWGDTLLASSEGSLKVWNGSSFVKSNVIGTWGLGSTSGTNSFTEMLLSEYLYGQTKVIESPSMRLVIGETNKNQNDGSGSRPNYINPIGRLKGYSATGTTPYYIFKSGSFHLLKDEVDYQGYQIIRDTQSITKTDDIIIGPDILQDKTNKIGQKTPQTNTLVNKLTQNSYITTVSAIKSAFGNDVAVNGIFATDTGWTKGTGWSISSNKAIFSPTGSTSDIKQDTLTNALTYKIIVTLTLSAGGLSVKAGSSGNSTVLSASGTYEVFSTCAGSTDVIFEASAAFEGYIEKVVVQQQVPVTSISINAIGTAVFKTNDVLNVADVDGDEVNEFTVSADQGASDTSISVTSKLITEDILEGSIILVNQNDLAAQYQNKTKGTVGGFDITATSIDSGSVAISSYIDDDTFGTASATSLATSESIKAYVDTQVETADTLAEVLANGNTTGGTDISVNDDDKITFGASADLQIYHDQNNSFIRDAGVGDLYLQASDNIYFQTYGSGKRWISLNENAGVQLFYNDSQKFETTNTGISITGGGVFTDSVMIGSSSSPSRKLEATSTSSYVAVLNSSQNNSFLSFNDANTSGDTYVAIGSENGDLISRAGNTERMRLTTDGRLGIGVSSPHTLLNLNDNNVAGEAQFGIGDVSSYYLAMGHNSAGNTDGFIGTVYNNDAARFDIRMKGTAQSDSKVTVLGSGNVGINQVNPTEKLHVVGDALITGDSHADAFKPAVSGNPIKFKNFDSTTEFARITDGGKLLIGQTTDSGDILQVTGNNNVFAARLNGGTTGGQSYGLRVRAGTNSVDTSLLLENTGGTDLFRVAGDGTATFSGQVTIPATPVASTDAASKGYVDAQVSATDSLQEVTTVGNTTTNSVTIGNAASPNNALEVYGNADSGVARFRHTSNGAYGSILLGSVNRFIGDVGTYIFKNGSSELMRLTSSGFLGLGASSPASKLDIHQGGITLDTDWPIKFGPNAQIEGNTSGTKIRFDATAGFNWTDGGTTNMQLLDNGNLLLGTTTDSGGKLQITASASAQQTTILKGYDVGTTDNLVVKNSLGTKTFSISNNGQVNIDGSQKLVTSDASIELRNNATGLMSFKSAANYGITFGDDGGEAMRINTSSNNVLIGTTTDVGDKLFVDGSIRITDNSFLSVGTSADLAIYHDSTDSYIKNAVGDLYIRNDANAKDIIFVGDDGSGSIETYFFLDGSIGLTTFPDNKKLAFGTGNDLQIKHTGTHSYITQAGTGNLYISNTRDGKDIILQSDNGTGGTADYITLDGSQTTINLQKTVLIGTTTNTGAYKIDVAGKQRVQDTLELDDVLMLNAISTPSDPAAGKSVIYMDSSDGGIKCKINVGGTVVERTIASFE